MVDYSSWPYSEDFSVTQIQLDKLNPRMPEHNENLKQEDIIDLMIENYKVKDLAESIAANGFLPTELMIIVVENEIPIVVEGNRRITALKLLLNPDLAPLKLRPKLSELNKAIEIKALLTPRVLIAPSREAASPLIFNKHTTSTEIPWSPIMQAEFYESVLVEKGLDAATNSLAETYNVSVDDFNKAIARLNLYRRISKYNYDKGIAEKVSDKLKFDITTLERVINSSITKKLAKFKIENNVIVEKDAKKLDFLLFSLVNLMFNSQGKLHKLTSRTANNQKQIEGYVRAILRLYVEDTEDEQQDETSPDVPSGPDFPVNGKGKQTDDSSDDDADEVDDIPKKPKPQKRSRFINDGAITFNPPSASAGNKRIFEELRLIDYTKAPCSVAVVLRVFLERVIRSYLKSIRVKKLPVKIQKTVIIDGEEKSIVETKKQSIGDVEFGVILEWLSGRDNEIVGDELKKILKTFKSSSSESIFSLSTLNTIMHNPNRIIDAKDLKYIWDSLEPILEFFLSKPTDNE